MGIVMDIQRFSLHDGPGIRSTVFLKGCNLRCKWCHNPESMQREPELMFLKERCSGCGACSLVCSQKCHTFSEGVHEIHRELCIQCGKCVEACPNAALSITGKEYSVEDVMKVIEKDSKYYIRSGGGITFSGGEATLQFDFLYELMKQCRDRGFQVALETNGFLNHDKLLKIMPLTNLFLLDYKLTDQEEHVKWTGASNQMVLKTLSDLQVLGGAVILRCPMIPGINDNNEHFHAIRVLKEKYDCIKQIELMAYHDIGKGKWEQCGKEYELGDLQTVSAQQKKEWEEKLL